MCIVLILYVFDNRIKNNEHVPVKKPLPVKRPVPVKKSVPVRKKKVNYKGWTPKRGSCAWMILKLMTDSYLRDETKVG